MAKVFMRRVLSSARGTLVASALGFVVVLLDVSVVNVALDDLRRAWSADVAALQWVVNAYALVFAALLLTAGALGDRLGARRVFMAGFVVFTLASAACGLAPSLRMLVAARLLQGLGAALLVPNSLTMLQRAFKDNRLRSRAVGWWGAAGGVALAAGPVVGGLLIAHFGWRSIFLVNLPLGVVGILLTMRFTAPHETTVVRSFDWPGQIACIVALASFACAISMAASLGWNHAFVVAGLLLSGASASCFIYIEGRARSPMLPLDLFRISTFTVVSVTGLVVNFAYYGLIIVFSLFFQLQQGLSPQRAGLAFLPMTVVLVLVNVLAGRLLPRMGIRRLMVTGLVMAAVGYSLLMASSIEGPYSLLAIPMLIAASGIAITVPTMTNATLSSVPASRTGIASGVLNSARQVGGMVGVAACGYLIRDTTPAAFMSGMHAALAIAALLLSVAAWLNWTYLLRSADIRSADISTSSSSNADI